MPDRCAQRPCRLNLHLGWTAEGMRRVVRRPRGTERSRFPSDSTVKATSCDGRRRRRGDLVRSRRWPPPRRAQNPCAIAFFLRDGLEEKEKERGRTGGCCGAAPAAPARRPLPNRAAGDGLGGLRASPPSELRPRSARRPTATGGATATCRAARQAAPTSATTSPPPTTTATSSARCRRAAKCTPSSRRRAAALRQPFTRGTVPRGAAAAGLGAGGAAAPRPRRLGPKGRRAQGGAVSLKRQASAGGGGALGLQAISKLREAKALEGAVRRSADPPSAPPSPSA